MFFEVDDNYKKYQSLCNTLIKLNNIKENVSLKQKDHIRFLDKYFTLDDKSWSQLVYLTKDNLIAIKNVLPNAAQLPEHFFIISPTTQADLTIQRTYITLRNIELGERIETIIPDTEIEYEIDIFTKLTANAYLLINPRLNEKMNRILSSFRENKRPKKRGEFYEVLAGDMDILNKQATKEGVAFFDVDVRGSYLHSLFLSQVGYDFSKDRSFADNAIANLKKGISENKITKDSEKISF